MQDLKVAIIGLGFVGQAFRDFFAPYAEIVEYDPKDHGEYPTAALGSCDFAMICVDTPSSGDGSCDVTNVVEAVKRVPVERVLIKSAVVPGTTAMLATATGKSICVSPEYISETANNQPYWAGDPAGVPFTILGGEPESRRYFMDALQPIVGPGHRFYQCTSSEAELIKYMENAFLATKVAFVNEFYDLAAAVGADWHAVREGWLLDPRVGRSHTAVFPADRGFGGKCLPKDVAAITALAREFGVPLEILEAVRQSNAARRDEG